MLQLENYLNKQIVRTLKKLGFPEVNYQIDRPKQEAHGDISVNLAMLLAKPLKQPPRKIAEQFRAAFELDTTVFEKIEIAGPGFINFFIADSALRQTVQTILSADQDYGKVSKSSPQRALVEFVSANPTGPLTVGHGRQAVLGDTIANLLEQQGYQVTREYYFNNAGRQMRVLADSVRLRYLELLGEAIEFPEDYYQGEYIKDIARQLVETHGQKLRDCEDADIFKEAAENAIFTDIKVTLSRLGIHFDIFFNELDLYESGEIERVLALLREKDLAYDKDGAVWFRATRFGLEQDRVIVKSSGEPTYRLPDIAYHKNKLERGYDAIIDLFGADHIATYPDVLAGLRALGLDADKVKVLIHQFVTLYEGAEKVKMSTRKANYITLDELIDDVGADVTRWFFLMRSMQSHLNFDLKLAKTQSDENPVYYNQYAHARICSILRNAEEQGIKIQETPDFSALTEKGEFRLIKELMLFPQILQKCAREFEPHLLTQYLSELSGVFHRFYTEHRVIGDDPVQTQARLGLCLATRTVLRNGFKVLGISAPERM